MPAPEPAGVAGMERATEMAVVAAKDKSTVAAKGVYELDDHMLSREAIIERYKVGVETFARAGASC